MKFTFLFLLIVLLSCTRKPVFNPEYDGLHEQEPNFFLAEPSTSNDPVRNRLSEIFLVEQYNVGAFPSMMAAFKANPPGGILFWNGNRVGALELREAIRTYSMEAEKIGLQPLLFSTDYEGGSINLAPNGNSVAGVQRFTKGFTPLVHPRWLGLSMPKFGAEMCRLHGSIMTRELKSVGINYPLSTVSDLATQSLTSLRGISKSAEDASSCLLEILDQFRRTQDLIFVTKHFPGLGLTRGDTHDGTVVSTITDPATLEKHKKTFVDLVDATKGSKGALSIMTTHAKFLAYDSHFVTTESKKTITDLLKNQLDFRGLVVSDAMWMGEYGSMSTTELMPVYLNSFLAGIDLLMIPGSRFAQAITYFRRVYDNQLTDEERQALILRTQLSWEEIQQRFLDRLENSFKVHDIARGAMKAAHHSLGSGEPTAESALDRQRYLQIFDETKSSLLTQ